MSDNGSWMDGDSTSGSRTTRATPNGGRLRLSMTCITRSASPGPAHHCRPTVDGVAVLQRV